MTFYGAAPSLPAPACACATYADGSRHATLCAPHAADDPCLTASRITGKRRKGTIRRGVCTFCGWPATPRRVALNPKSGGSDRA